MGFLKKLFKSNKEVIVSESKEDIVTKDDKKNNNDIVDSLTYNILIKLHDGTNVNIPNTRDNSDEETFSNFDFNCMTDIYNQLKESLLDGNEFMFLTGVMIRKSEVDAICITLSDS